MTATFEHGSGCFYGSFVGAYPDAWHLPFPYACTEPHPLGIIYLGPGGGQHSAVNLDDRDLIEAALRIRALSNRYRFLKDTQHYDELQPALDAIIDQQRLRSLWFCWACGEIDKVGTTVYCERCSRGE